MKAISLGHARCHRATTKAILVTLLDEGTAQRWVPLDCVHDDSEVYESGQDGELRVKEGSWWAKQEGFCD